MSLKSFGKFCEKNGTSQHKGGALKARQNLNQGNCDPCKIRGADFAIKISTLRRHTTAKKASDVVHSEWSAAERRMRNIARLANEAKRSERFFAVFLKGGKK